jgi:hypothetical protein
VISALGMAELTVGAAPELPCDADQSVPTRIRSDGTALVDSGMPTPGIDGRFSGGYATKLLTPVSSGPVTGSSTASRAVDPAAAMPGTGGAGGGMRRDSARGGIDSVPTQRRSGRKRVAPVTFYMCDQEPLTDRGFVEEPGAAPASTCWASPGRSRPLGVASTLAGQPPCRIRSP